MILLSLLRLTVTNAWHTLCALEDTGTKQYQEFVKNVLEECSISIHDPIKKNSMFIFKQAQHKIISKQGKKVKMLQNSVALFGQLYISMQSRDGNSFPPSLSDYRKLHLPSTKSELLKCIPPITQFEPLLFYNCHVLDGAAVIHFLPIAGAVTFNDYAENILFLIFQCNCRTAKNGCCVGHIPTRQLERVN